MAMHPNTLTAPVPSQPDRDGAPEDPMAAEAEAREAVRLAALDRLDVLDTPREEAFDRITRLARKVFDVPIAIVSFIDGHRQWYKSCQGLSTSEAPREQTFCTHTIAAGRPLVVEDAHVDPRFAENPLVTGEPNVGFYAGVPLRTTDGQPVGTLCLIDTKPRHFTEGQVEIMTELAEITMDELDLRLSASRDSLTGAMSRRSFRDEIARSAALALRHHDALSCIAFDLDHFKEVNDRYGHSAGDIVLARAVRSCVRELRETDRIGRVGGEEFAVLLPNTNAAGALEVAERLRRAIADMEIAYDGRTLKVTASFGVASLASARDADALLRQADEALYEAKDSGRNRVVAWKNPVTPTAATRRRVLKAGQILFNGHASTVDCTVRSLSEEGAGIDVSSTVGIPKRFDLRIKADNFERPCEVVAQTEKHLEVAF